MAALHGVDLDKEIKNKQLGIEDGKPFEFHDQKYYEENFTMEERKELTKKMMVAHKNFFGGGGDAQFGVDYQIKGKGKGIGIG